MDNFSSIFQYIAIVLKVVQIFPSTSDYFIVGTIGVVSFFYIAPNIKLLEFLKYMIVSRGDKLTSD